MTRVTVAVAVNDDGAYVGHALDSVLSEVGPDDEVIVVDDGSTDETPAVLRSFGDRLRVLTPGRVGLSAARNLGIRSAAGRYVSFIDADDLWVPTSLSARLEAIERTGADVVVGLTDEFLDAQVEDPTSHGLRPAELQVRGWFLGALLARRAVFARALFDEDRPLAITVDWLARARQEGFRFEHLDEVTLRRRIRPGSMTTDAPRYHDALLSALRANIGV